MTLYERLRDAPAVCMIPLQGGVGTPVVTLTDRERAAVLNLIEAAQEMVSWDYVGDADQDVYKRLERAVAVFVSGQEEPK